MHSCTSHVSIEKDSGYCALMNFGTISKILFKLSLSFVRVIRKSEKYNHFRANKYRTETCTSQPRIPSWMGLGKAENSDIQTSKINGVTSRIRGVSLIAGLLIAGLEWNGRVTSRHARRDFL